ncbi:hypothetical protein [Alkalitalea saponilacus]|nr:hypothetical protein [Alkalitalea saponilacus]
MRSITRDFPREYNGIDTLIRIDGYYFGLCDDYLCRPFIITDRNEFKGRLGKYYSHNQIVAGFHEFYSKMRTGNYNVVNDTITVNTVAQYGPWSFDILKYVFVIHNSTTLERIYSSNVRNDTIVNKDRIMFLFYPFDADWLK